MPLLQRSRSLIGFIALLLSSAPVWPQASTSSVRGVVRDQTGAVVPGATVTLINTATSAERTAKTNEAGLYLFPGVFPGPYHIVIEAAGMQKFEGLLTLQVQQDAVVDGTLAVSGTVSEVTVQDVTPMLRTDTPSIGRVLERRRIEQLPINGRAITALLATVPGMETGRLRAYGMRMGTMTYQFDGTQHNESWEGWAQQRPPGLDAVEEFRVEINSASAKFTRPATLIVTSRSGTNSFHGAVFETNRNNAIGKARQRQDNYSKAPYLNRNEFGASAGGPVRLPGLYNGKDRTFWFAAWEASRMISPTTQGWRVPTQEMRNGDFRGLVDSQGRLSRIYDPWTTDSKTWQRQQFSYRGQANVIDPARISPLAKSLFAVTPLPSNPEVNPMVDNNWWGPTPSWTRSWTLSTRFDHRFSGRDSVFVRYTYSDQSALYQYGGQVMLDNLGGAVTRVAPNKSVTGTWVHSISPTLFSEFLVSVTRDYQTRGTGDGKTDYLANLGLPNPFKQTFYPQMIGTGLSGYGYYVDSGFDSPSWYIQMQENATKILGKHEFQFGFHFRQDRLDVAFPSASYHDWSTRATQLYDAATPPTNPLNVPYTGHDLANMFLGVMNYSAQYRRNYLYMRGSEYAPYFQDNWKVTPRLTLNLGLRYELRPPVAERDSSYVSFDLAKHAYVTANDMDAMYRSGALLPQVVKRIQDQGGKFLTWKEAGWPQSLENMSRKNFGPRLGFAYRAGDGALAFLVRGGYRISTYPVPYRAWARGQGWSPPSQATFSNSLTNTVQSPDGLPAYGMRSVPQIVAGRNSRNAVDVNDTRTLARGFAGASFKGLEQPYGRVQDWNLMIEKEVMRNTVLRAGYVGNYSGNQEVYVRHNEAPPPYVWYATRGERMPTGEYASVAMRSYDTTLYGSINEYTNKGWSRFNGVQLEFERRYDKGYAYQLFYLVGNTLMAGGRETDEAFPSLNTFMPGAVPADLDDRIRFLLYRRDLDIPKHRVRWNFLADLPFGRGKAVAGSARGVLQQFIGGWQVAGTGSVWSNFFSLPTYVYPANAKTIEMYGYKYRVEDCRSGRCIPGYLWWNGYIPANQINSYDRNGRPNGVMGVPDKYKPAAEPLIPWPKVPNPNDPMYAFYGGNTVWVPLKDGTIQRTTFDNNLHPWRNQFLPGVRQWGLDASLFKTIRLTEKVTLRFNADCFNVLNHPNNANSIGGDGVLRTNTSGGAARVTQLTLRLIW